MACNGDYDNPKGREAGRRFDTSEGYPSRRRRGRVDAVPGAGTIPRRYRPGLTRSILAGSAGGFPDVAIGRRIAGIAGAGGRTGNRFRLRGRSGVPWGAVRGSCVPVVRPGRVRPVGRRAGGFADVPVGRRIAGIAESGRWWPDRKPFPASRAAWRPVGRPTVGDSAGTKARGCAGVNRHVITWPDGRRYVGEVLDASPHGLGVMTWPADGRRYVGRVAEIFFPHGVVGGCNTVLNSGWQPTARMMRE